MLQHLRLHFNDGQEIALWWSLLRGCCETQEIGPLNVADNPSFEILYCSIHHNVCKRLIQCLVITVYP